MSEGSGEFSKGGSKILRYAAREEGFQAPAETRNLERVERHLERFLGPAETVFHEIISDLVHIDVHFFPPTTARPAITLATTGMSDLPMTVPDGREDYAHSELLITLPPDWKLGEEPFKDERWYWPVRWLKKLARFPHEYRTWLGHGHSIPNGDPAQPLGPGTKLSGFVLMPPVSLPAESFTLTDEDGPPVHFYSLYPLYDDEMKLKLAQGTDALIDLLEQAGVMDQVDPARPSVAPRKKLFGLF